MDLYLNERYSKSKSEIQGAFQITDRRLMLLSNFLSLAYIYAWTLNHNTEHLLLPGQSWSHQNEWDLVSSGWVWVLQCVWLIPEIPGSTATPSNLHTGFAKIIYFSQGDST